MLGRLLKSHPKVGPLLAPKYHLLLPPVAAFKSSRKAVLLPPPHCVGRTGSFSGTLHSQFAWQLCRLWYRHDLGCTALHHQQCTQAS
jgi:hypothetical protein